MDLVHADEVNIRTASLTQGNIRQHLHDTADNRGISIDQDIPGEQSNVVYAEDLAKREDSLRHQRFNEGCVKTHLILDESGEVRSSRH